VLTRRPCRAGLWAGMPSRVRTASAYPRPMVRDESAGYGSRSCATQVAMVLSSGCFDGPELRNAARAARRSGEAERHGVPRRDTFLTPQARERGSEELGPATVPAEIAEHRRPDRRAGNELRHASPEDHLGGAGSSRMRSPCTRCPHHSYGLPAHEVPRGASVHARTEAASGSATAALRGRRSQHRIASAGIRSASC
jgi:hypothetical protein